MRGFRSSRILSIQPSDSISSEATCRIARWSASEFAIFVAFRCVAMRVSGRRVKLIE